MTNRYQVLEVNDSRDFCECCGKTGLKRVVFIRDVETDEVKHFGTTCAASPVKGFGVDKEIKAAIAKFSSFEKCLNAIAHGDYRRQGGKYIQNEDRMSSRCADMGLFQTIRAKHATEKAFNY